jgi:hypothetical protein
MATIAAATGAATARRLRVCVPFDLLAVKMVDLGHPWLLLLILLFFLSHFLNDVVHLIILEAAYPLILIRIKGLNDNVICLVDPDRTPWLVLLIAHVELFVFCRKRTKRFSHIC